MKETAWVIFFDPDTTEVLIGKRAAGTNNAGQWGFFGGGVDKNEKPLMSIVREIHEELGVIIGKNDLKKLGVVTLPTKRVHWYVVKVDKSKFAFTLNKKEHTQTKWIDVHSLKNKNIHHVVDALLSHFEKAVKQKMLESSADVAAILHPYGFRQDNPGGYWLKNEQEKAAEKMVSYSRSNPIGKGLSGTVTAWTKGKDGKGVLLKLPLLLDGANDEIRVPGILKYDNLYKEISDRGHFHDDEPILIGVNHLGDAYVLEGNTRLAVATNMNLPYIRAEINWFNGGEDAPGRWNWKFMAEKIK